MKKFENPATARRLPDLSRYCRVQAGKTLIAGFAFMAASGLIFAQDHPNLEGVWDRADGGTSDIYHYLLEKGIEIPFTALGAERYKNVDVSKNPNGYCLPPGPSRMITGPSPFMIVQGTAAIALLNENHGTYRIINMDGKGHPEEMMEYPEYIGHSIGEWQGNVLVVDTIGIREETWLDSEGLQHSGNLHLTETFERIAPDTIRYTVTYDDPEFYARPFTLEANYLLQDTRIIEYACAEGEQDLDMLMPTFPNRDLDIRVFTGDEE